MRMWFILVAILISSICNGQTYLRSNEQLIFFFQTNNGKQVYLVKDKEEDYISYRFGTKSKVEFEYPGTYQDSWQKFTYSYYLRGGGKANEGMDLNYLYFTNGGYQYILYQTYFAVDDKNEVGVKVTNLKTKNTVDIKGDFRTRKGTLVDFRENRLLKIGDELFY